MHMAFLRPQRGMVRFKYLHFNSPLFLLLIPYHHVRSLFHCARCRHRHRRLAHRILPLNPLRH